MDKTQILKLMQDGDKCEALAEEILSQIATDDEAPHKIGYFLLKAYAENNVDDALVALCGWTLESLCARAGIIEDREGVLLTDVDGNSKARETVYLWTDGACKGNPGPGGWGAILRHEDVKNELCGGEPCTTNNRMELTGAIKGLEAIEKPSKVILTSDSKYLVDSVTKGWVNSWRLNGWRKADGKPALNVDLWEKLLIQLARHDVEFVWVKGHAGHPENERCDQLAVKCANEFR